MDLSERALQVLAWVGFGIFSGIIVVNVFVVVCIIALLFATRLIIINPIIKGKKKNDIGWNIFNITYNRL